MQQNIPSLTFSEAFKLGFVNYAKFTGRARRSEFFNFIIGVLIIQIILCIFIPISKRDPNEDDFFLIGLPIVFFLIAICPVLSVTVRRLHDIGYSGNYILIGLIPLFGIIYLFYLCSFDSEMNLNNYGPCPKYIIPTTNLNNYKPPLNVIAVSPVAQPAVVVVPIQSNPVVHPPIAPYPQQDPMVPPPMAPYPQQDPMVPPPMYPQQYPIVPLPMYRHQNPIVQTQAPSYAPQDDPYSKPNPLQPGPYYN